MEDKPIAKVPVGDKAFYAFDAPILQNEGMDAAYVEVPYDIKALFGKGRLLTGRLSRWGHPVTSSV